MILSSISITEGNIICIFKDYRVCSDNGRRLARSSSLQNSSLRWRHNGRDSVSNNQPHDCLLNRLFKHRSKKTSKFPAQMASYAENVSIWWRHHVPIWARLSRQERLTTNLLQPPRKFVSDKQTFGKWAIHNWIARYINNRIATCYT